MDKIYAVRLMAKHGHQANNPVWVVGRYIRECEHMIRSVECVPHLWMADFGTKVQAKALVDFAHDSYPELSFEWVEFQEVQ